MKEAVSKQNIILSGVVMVDDVFPHKQEDKVVLLCC